MRKLLSYLLFTALVVAVAAQLLRDRTLWLGYLMYLPLWPLAATAVLWDLLQRGRGLARRWLLLISGVMSGLLAIALIWTPAAPAEGNASQQQLRLVHWNTQWGGPHGQRSLREILDTLEAQQPDLICLSEAPWYDYLRHDWLQRRPDWFTENVQSPVTRQDYNYRLTVLSRYPVTLQKEWALRTGHAALFEVQRGTRTLRVLMVDLLSRPTLARSPTLVEAAEIVARYAAAGSPIDLVVGDFNTPGRFLGFDAIASAGEGYRRAALWSGQWRGTWPSRLPLSIFDIDHVWVRSGLPIESSHIFTTRASDHRGQATLLHLP